MPVGNQVDGWFSTQCIQDWKEALTWDIEELSHTEGAEHLDDSRTTVNFRHGLNRLVRAARRDARPALEEGEQGRDICRSAGSVPTLA